MLKALNICNKLFALKYFEVFGEYNFTKVMLYRLNRGFLINRLNAIFLISLFLVSSVGYAQFADDFSDGNFTTNPEWTGDTDRFVVNAENQLQLSDGAASGSSNTAYLSTFSRAIVNAEWEFDYILNGTTTSSNFARVYLISSNSNLLATTNIQSYFLQIGTTNGPLRLEYQNGSSISTVISSENGVIQEDANVSIKVTRDSQGNWELFLRNNLVNEGEAYFEYELIGQAQNQIFEGGNYFGVYCRYSSTRRNDYKFDNFTVIGESATAGIDPEVADVEVLSQNQLKISFNKALEENSATDVQNYFVEGLGNPQSVVFVAGSFNDVELTFIDDFVNRLDYELEISPITDLDGLASETTFLHFLFFVPDTPEPGDVIFTEIFSRVTPQLGLPVAQYVEIHNTTNDKFFDLAGWQFHRGSTSYPLSSATLAPGGYLILTNSSNVAAYEPYGATLGFSMPGINLNSDTLTLTSDGAVVLDALRYQESWYRSTDKARGGFSRELINPGLNCFDQANWVGSSANPGGTPGQQNSVFDEEFNGNSPVLLSVRGIEANRIRLKFDKGIDADALNDGQFIFEGAEFTVTGIELSPDFGSTVWVDVSPAIGIEEVLSVEVSGLKDCNGNVMQTKKMQFVYDIFPPNISEVFAAGTNKLLIAFREPLNAASFGDEDLFEANNEIFKSREMNLVEDSVILVTFANDFQDGVEYQLSVTGVTDTSNNAITTDQFDFTYYTPYIPQNRELVITEIMAAPNEATQLPNFKYVEILNVTEEQLVLTGIQLADRTYTTTLNTGVLEPGEYGIFASATAAPYLRTYGKVIIVPGFSSSAFSPNTTSDDISIFNQTGERIDFVSYSNTWFEDANKRAGGYALETVNPFLKCSGRFNWKETADAGGGTPGLANTVFDDTLTGPSPNLIAVQTADDNALRLLFDIAMDEGALQAAEYVLSPALAIAEVMPSEDLQSVTLVFSANLVHDQAYSISIDDLQDCNGNDIAVRSIDFVFDNQAPELIENIIYNTTTVDLVFSERLNSTQATRLLNYTVNQSLGNPTSASMIDGRTVRLVFSGDFLEGVNYEITINDVQDIASNAIQNFRKDITREPVLTPARGELIITELMPRPRADWTMPNTEWVEIHNTTSDKRFVLTNYRLTNDGSGTTLGLSYINPGEYLILAPNAGREAMSSFGRVYGLSNWPTLKVRGDEISLLSPDALVLDRVPYTENWSKDLNKYNQNGYSLELKNPGLLCSGEFNWRLSKAETGASPGQQNTVYDDSKLNQAATPIRITTSSDNQITLEFDFPMDATTLLAHNFSLAETSLSVVAVNPSNTDNSAILLTFDTDLENGAAYSLQIANVLDCNGQEPVISTINFVFDSRAPELDEYIIYDAHNIDLHFDEPLNQASAITIANYAILPGIGEAAEASLINATTVRLRFGNSIQDNTSYQLVIDGIEDLNTNTIDSLVVPFTKTPRVVPAFTDLLITEIMSKPVAGRLLPNSEWVEIYNTTDQRIFLNGFTLSNDMSQTNAIGLQYIDPGEYVVICPTNAVSNLSQYGKTIGVGNWRTLKVRGDEVSIITHTQEIIHSVPYRENWYRDQDKYDEGGYSLEMIDTDNPCGEQANWMASGSNTGGTPAAQNSVRASNPDVAGPKVQQAVAPEEDRVIVRFNEKLDVANLRTSYFQISDNINVTNVSWINPKEVRLHISPALQARIAYEIIINGITDCSGNIIQSNANSTNFALTETAAPGDIVLNEILFHPPVGGVEFVEVYNNSPKYINLKEWSLGGRSGNPQMMSTSDIIVEPQSFMVFTQDIAQLKADYPQLVNENTWQVSSLPSYASTSGIVTLMNQHADTVERFDYNADMHNPALRDRRGVSLERISAQIEANDENAWASAAKEKSYATPGAINSQAKGGQIIAGEIRIEPQTFAPGSPGRGFALINYDLQDIGNIANITVLDMRGRKIKSIANNDVLGRTGFYRWYGDDDEGNQMRVGYYIIYIEIFNDQGNIQRYRKKVAIAAQ